MKDVHLFRFLLGKNREFIVYQKIKLQEKVTFNRKVMILKSIEANYRIGLELKHVIKFKLLIHIYYPNYVIENLLLI